MTPSTIAHKLEVLRGHCDDVGRDRAEIEVTALLNVPDDAEPGAIVARAEGLAAVGVRTVVASSSQPDPAPWLEERWGPAMGDLAAIEPAGW